VFNQLSFEDRVKFAANTECPLGSVEVSVNKVNVVEHPSHYNQGSIETIDYLESVLTKEEYCGACKMNVLKYVSREKHKNGLEDLKKAQWYLDRLITYLEKAA
jgi:hypothetical protein